jgi:hypothetical protein
MRGTVRKISILRRFIIDLMRASVGVPFVSLSRPLDVRQLVEARAAILRPPGWAAILVKAFCLVAKDEPVLRTLYAQWPWPHFYEMPRSVVMVAIARVEGGEDCVLLERVAAADELPLSAIDAQIRRAKHAPIEEIPSFRRILKVTRLPLPLRRLGWLVALNIGRLHASNFGSLTVTSVAAYGGGELHAISPGPFVLSYRALAPDQSIDVVIRWDHRISDAALIARTLSRLEQVLNTQIAAELRGSGLETQPKAVRAVAT